MRCAVRSNQSQGWADVIRQSSAGGTIGSVGGTRKGLPAIDIGDFVVSIIGESPKETMYLQGLLLLKGNIIATGL